MKLMIAFLGEINSAFFTYTRLPGVENFPLLLAVTPLGKCVACTIGFLIYCFKKNPFFISSSLFSSFPFYPFLKDILTEGNIRESEKSSLHCISFLQPKIVLMGKKFKIVHVQDISSLYSNTDMINRFLGGIRFSSTGREKDIVLKPFSRTKRANIDTSREPYTP